MANKFDNKKYIKSKILKIFIILFITINYDIFFYTNSILGVDSKNKVDEERKVQLELNSLKVEDYELYPEFNANIVNYYISIPTSKKSLDIQCEANIENTKINVTGNKSLNKNENVIQILLSKSGYLSRNYKIYATKQSDNGPKLTSLSIDGVDLMPQFESNKYYYSVDIKYSNKIEPLKIVAVPESDSIKMEILGNNADTLTEGDNNIITIILNDSKNSTIYQINATFQKNSIIAVNNGNDNKIQINIKDNTTKLLSKLKNFYNENKIPFIVACLVIIILLIIIIATNSHKKKIKENRKKMKNRV